MNESLASVVIESGRNQDQGRQAQETRLIPYLDGFFRLDTFRLEMEVAHDKLTLSEQSLFKVFQKNRIGAGKHKCDAGRIIVKSFPTHPGLSFQPGEIKLIIVEE